MPESLENQFISDLYTSLLHLSGADLGSNGPINKVFDGAGNTTGLALSGRRVLINNYIYPEGFQTRSPLEWLDSFFPIGSLQLTFDDNNPTDRIAGTVWTQVSQGRFLVGTGLNTDKNGVEREFCPGGAEEEEAGSRGGSGDTAGEYRVTLTEDQLPAHTHDVNIGAADVQISNPAGTGSTSQVNPVGTINSSLTFREQENARYRLLRDVSPPGDEDYFRLANWEDSQENWPERAWLYALDFGFDRGSAANYSQADRELYMIGALADTYQFKELIGIWNGESRFVSDINVRVDVGVGRGGRILRTVKTPYEYAKELGAVDIGSATAGNYLTNNNETPIISGNTEVLERQEQSNNTRISTSTGEDGSHNNILPSYGVYVWKRIA
mgnify:CR=1 FL=1|tara:strand:- start:5592 stop:6740 length:1149 start_codon:yes stop_codon:yes gene_type:complete